MKSDKVPVPSQVQERVLPEARCDDTAVPRVPDSPHTAPPSSPPCSQRGPCTRCPGHSRLLPPGHWHPVLHPRRRAVAGVVTAETGQVSAAAGGIWRRQPTSQLTAGLQSLHGGWSRHAQGQSWAEGVGWLRPSPAHPRWPCFVSPAPSRLHPPRHSVSWARPLHPHPRLSHAVLCGGRAGSAESARRPPQAASNRSPDHVGSALQAGV